MTFLIRQISHTADGREIVRQSTLPKPHLSIGRAAENDIHLQDLSVVPDHARIEQIDARRITVRSTGTLGFDVDGRTVTRVDIDTVEGAELRFGGHRITVSHGEADGIVLSVQRVDALSDALEEKDEARVFSLTGLLPGRRGMAWALVLSILIGFLAVPIFSYATRPAQDTRNIYAVRGERQAQMKQASLTKQDDVTGDAAWSPGPLSQTHHALEGKCESCHVKAFVSVQDSACQTCHNPAQVHEHAPAARIAMARAAPGMGGRILSSFASAFGKPGDGACVDCHTEHEGAGPMQQTAQQFCTDCHGSMNERLKDTKLGNAGDFGTSHPQFQPAVMTVAPSLGLKLPRFDRVSLDAKPVENNGLKFPHDIHLSRAGGVARMARTLKGQKPYGDALACADCHRPTADGVRFLPVDMETDCQSCHSLGFESIGGTVRTLRHGEPAQVIADLRAFYRSTGPARPIALGSTARRLPGDYAAAKVGASYLRAAAARPGNAEAAIRAVFSRGGACYDCHVIAPPGAGGKANWQITPVHQPMRYMANGWFDHAAHKIESCESCHAAPKSSKASDLLLPGISSCRDCHGGEQAKADVPSGCALCHSYHVGDGAPWVPANAIRDKTVAKVIALSGARVTGSADETLGETKRNR
ncbi:MAG: cytochrome c3 family protein [Sphingobium sp.]|uniref:FHA domain-containing protein n=1 Tax=Sphingobium sp. TaxID=1912891 RepID=UPI0029BC2E1A|nr:FHA domain-containing protein [Sphingobium sp.]MDX3909035.1 cytochrome c3 family protein [Sphingobium sp.]